MTPNSESSTGVLLVAIDVAKQIHEVLIEPRLEAASGGAWGTVSGITTCCDSACRPFRFRFASDLKPPAPITGHSPTFCISAGLNYA